LKDVIASLKLIRVQYRNNIENRDKKKILKFISFSFCMKRCSQSVSNCIVLLCLRIHLSTLLWQYRSNGHYEHKQNYLLCWSLFKWCVYVQILKNTVLIISIRLLWIQFVFKNLLSKHSTITRTPIISLNKQQMICNKVDAVLINYRTIKQRGANFTKSGFPLSERNLYWFIGIGTRIWVPSKR